MGTKEETLPLAIDPENTSIIKVIGVGGGGGNAVNHMYRQGIKDVTFVVCNTDNQALKNSPVPNKIQLGTDTTEGLGAGGDPEVAKRAAEESLDRIQEVLKDNTKMVFVTAGMGGGTGTGASPIVAKAARDMGILTVGIVTIPFAFEGNMKIKQALMGVASLSEHVDAILVINNEKLKIIHPDLELSNAFAKAEDVLANAAKAIAEIITINGYINTDFADVYSILKNGNVAIMNTGYASGENRISMAIEDALNSPLLNTNDVSGANKFLLSLYCSRDNEIKMDEVSQIHEFMSSVGENVQVIWGITFDETLGDNVKITLIATGFDVSDIPGMQANFVNRSNGGNTQTQPEPVVKPTYQSIYAPPVQAKEKPAETKTDIEKAMGHLYGNTLKADKKTIEPQIPVVSLYDLENDDALKTVEDIPAWKRKMMK